MRSSAARDEGVPRDVETQGLLGPLARGVHADPGSRHDRDRLAPSGCRDEEVVAQEVMTIKPSIDLQRPAEQARPLRAALDISDRLERGSGPPRHVPRPR